MSTIRVGDTVAFRRGVAAKCTSPAVAAFRGKVTEVTGDWLFIEAASGQKKVMPATNMVRVAPTGVILELVR